MRYKILFIINKLTYGGAGRMMAYLANTFSLEQFDIHLLTYEDNRIVPTLAPGVHHIDFQYSPPHFYAIRRFLQIQKIRKVIDEIQPDAILSFKPYPNILSILAAIGTGIPVIISERGDPYAHRGWFTMFRDFIYRFADGYVFQTNGAKNYFNQRIRKKAIVIPNPVLSEGIPAKWSGSRDGVIVSVGRFELKHKRQDILIQAFSKIAGKYPDIKLVLYGDGADEPEIERIIATCKLEGRVVLAGVTENVYEAIKKARMFILSSDHEGMPNALIEAMCVGLPCVSTDCSPGGAAELIEHMENGMLVKVGCIDALAEAMDFMLGHPQIAEKMGQNASKILNNQKPEVIIGQWENYINKHLSINSGNPSK